MLVFPFNVTDYVPNRINRTTFGGQISKPKLNQTLKTEPKVFCFHQNMLTLYVIVNTLQMAVDHLRYYRGQASVDVNTPH